MDLVHSILIGPNAPIRGQNGHPRGRELEKRIASLSRSGFDLIGKSRTRVNAAAQNKNLSKAVGK